MIKPSLVASGLVSLLILIASYIWRIYAKDADSFIISPILIVVILLTPIVITLAFITKRAHLNSWKNAFCLNISVEYGFLLAFFASILVITQFFPEPYLTIGKYSFASVFIAHLIFRTLMWSSTHIPVIYRNIALVLYVASLTLFGDLFVIFPLAFGVFLSNFTNLQDTIK